jgi:ribosome recycling factor
VKNRKSHPNCEKKKHVGRSFIDAKVTQSSFICKIQRLFITFVLFFKFVSMNEEVQLYRDDAVEKMEKALKHLSVELTKLRAGKASPSMLDGIMVNYYGSLTPIQQVANIHTPDARSIVIQPWEKKTIDAIEKAIFAANIGMTPSNNGEAVRLNVPPLTEDRRRSLVKQTKVEGENAKISIRNARRDAIDEYKKMLKQGLPEDVEKDAEEEMQKLTDKYYKKVDEILVRKETEIMTV